MTADSSDVDSYLAGLPETSRDTLEAMRRVVRDEVPGAVESISYRMPAFKYHGRALVYMAAFANHCGVYGMSSVIAAHAAHLAQYRISKGTVQVPIGEPMPEPLLRMLLREQVAQIEAAEAERRAKRSRRVS